MDLYNPLYVNRPTVEPELFASLRPVTYRGGFGDDEGHGMAGTSTTRKLACRFHRQCGELGGVAAELRLRRRMGCGDAQPAKSRDDEARCADCGHRERSRTRSYATEAAAELAQRLGTGTVGNAATAAALGDFFQYTIDHPVSLARQKTRHAAHRRQGCRGAEGLHLQPVRPGQAPAARPQVQEHLGRAPQPGTDHGLRGKRLRRRHPRARRAAERGTARQLRHRSRHRGRCRRSAPARRRSPA